MLTSVLLLGGFCGSNLLTGCSRGDDGKFQVAGLARDTLLRKPAAIRLRCAIIEDHRNPQGLAPIQRHFRCRQQGREAVHLMRCGADPLTEAMGPLRPKSANEVMRKAPLPNRNEQGKVDRTLL